MVFGKTWEDSGTGVATTRNVTTGKQEIEGDYLLNAQGEDVVAGTRDEAHRGDESQMPSSMRNVSAAAKSWRNTIAKPRTWNSPSSGASSGCCRRGRETHRQAAVRIAVE